VIIGHGIDLVEVPRIHRLRDRYGDRFLRRCFTEQEISDCQTRARPDRHFAVRYAAKEAYVKALGTGFVDGIRLCDIEVSTDKLGKPTIKIHGEVQGLTSKMRVSGSVLSLTHDGRYGAASVILTGS